MNQKLFGNYNLLEKLAMGGMAEIFLANAPGTAGISKFVAIKRILPQYSNHEEFIKMFRSEAKICVNLTHSNIASIFEFGKEEEQLFLAMEYIAGKNLRQITNKIKKEKRTPLSIQESVFIVKEICAGLNYAHRCVDRTTGKSLHIIHRDMSPQNVMVSYEGETKVLDFGIAKAENQVDQTRAGTLKGKFSYMSPEQASGEKIDLRTDVYSTGIILWELLTGERLFTSSNEINTLRKIRDGKVPPVRRLNPKAPLELEKIVSKALAKNPVDRFQNCGLLHKALNRFLNEYDPDFSAQNILKKMKSLYSKEIAHHSTKLIKYSNLKPSTKKAEDPFLENRTDAKASNNYTATQTINFEKLKVSGSGGVENTSTFIKPSPSTRSAKISYTNNYTQPAPPKKKQSIPVILASFVLIGVIGFSFKDSLNTAVQNLREPASKAQVSEPLSTPTTKPTHSQVPTTKKEDFIATKVVVISSKPSGAEIFLNGRSTESVTPARVRVPDDGSGFIIKLEKDGYYKYSKSFHPGYKGTREDFALRQLDLGYVNISSNSPRSQIIINGEALPKGQSTPLYNYVLPTGTHKIEAYDPITQKRQSKLIEIEKDKSARVNFRL